MSRYLARVSIEYHFANEKMELLGSFWAQLLDEIPQEYEAKAGINRFTFYTLYLTAECEDDARKAIMEAWDRAFPDCHVISDVLLTEYEEGSDTSKLMRSIYQGYFGVEEYQKLCTQLRGCIEILGEKDALTVIRKTNFVFAVDHGCGFTMLLSSFGDFLRRMGVYGTDLADGERTRYYDVVIGKENKEGCMDSDSFMEHLAEFREDLEYSILGVDISYYLDKNRHEELRTFIRRLDFYQDDFVFVFRLPFLEKNALDDAVGLLSDQMMVKTVAIPPYSDCVLMESFWNMVTDRNFTADTSIIELISDKIKQEKADGRFYGFKSIHKIAGEVMYCKAVQMMKAKAAGDDEPGSEIETDDLKGYVDRDALEVKGYEALSEMIGMETITERIREIVAQVKYSMNDEKLDRPCIHMRFTGAPGTGKTTVARILGRILKEEGILRKGSFLEYTGRDLCAEYVGQTAVKTSSICRDAYGSVLFIDEAYSLYVGDNDKNDFGREALATLVSEMENHRDDMLVVMAGYTDEMAELMKGNPGLRSRMPYVLDFPNYTREQLYEIFMLMVRKHFDYTPDLEETAKKFFDEISDATLSSKEFANARYVRNLYERTWSKGALRSQLAGSRKITLNREDFIAASSEKEFSEKLAAKKKLGF
ncbi:MAG: AAA family ATPase [Lachnospiraceae bacterium]|nr:AAA family ATPase [Lachnospiraceae bacterium]